MASLLYGAMALLLVDAAIEMGFIINTVRWLHVIGGSWFDVQYQGSQFSLAGKPLNLLVDQGHTSNGAAGTALVAISLGGSLALFLRNRQLRRNGSLSGFTSFLYRFWLWMTAISAVFTVAAFVYVFVETYQHANQHIDVAYASRLGNQPIPGPRGNVPYPQQSWTPQNWLPAVLELDLVGISDRSDIKFQLAIMKGWQWNLIPLMLIGIVVSVLAFMNDRKHKQGGYRSNGASRLEAARQKSGSPYS